MQIKELHPFGLMIEAKQSSEHVSQLNIEELRSLVHRQHILVLRGFQTFESAESFSDYCEHLGRVSVWPFGKVLELIEQANPSDHIFDNSYVPMHWDGMYRKEVPEFQVFHCVNAPESNQGGRTTFSHTPRAIEKAPKEVRKLWSRTTAVYERKMEFYDSKTVAPIICKHPVRGFPVIRYCEEPQMGDETFVNPSRFEFKGIEADEVKELHRSLRAALYDPENFYAHSWESGDIVITDNYTLLHGREAFTSGSARHLRRVHILGEPPLKNPHLVSHT